LRHVSLETRHTKSIGLVNLRFNKQMVQWSTDGHSLVEPGWISKMITILFSVML